MPCRDMSYPVLTCHVLSCRDWSCPTSSCRDQFVPVVFNAITHWPEFLWHAQSLVLLYAHGIMLCRVLSNHLLSSPALSMSYRITVRVTSCPSAPVLPCAHPRCPPKSCPGLSRPWHVQPCVALSFYAPGRVVSCPSLVLSCPAMSCPVGRCTCRITRDWARVPDCEYVMLLSTRWTA